jgi:hypothetical protein
VNRKVQHFSLLSPQANFVYTLPEPIEEEVVEFLVDPENESNLCAVISVNKLLLFGLEQRKHIERQELRVFTPNASERNSGEFTCGAYLTGTSKPNAKLSSSNFDLHFVRSKTYTKPSIFAGKIL